MRLELIALDKNWAREIAADGSAVLQTSCTNYSVVAPYLEDAVDALIAIYDRSREGATWTAYLVRDTAERAYIGMCSLADNGGGQIAIGYHTFPPYEGRGFAKAMVDELVTRAFRRSGATEIVADTPPQEGAAAAVLRGRKFHCTKTVNDTDRGRRWQWSLTLSTARHREGKPIFVPMLRTGALASLILPRG